LRLFIVDGPPGFGNKELADLLCPLKVWIGPVFRAFPPVREGRG
jgi:hypothetical protein